MSTEESHPKTNGLDQMSASDLAKVIAGENAVAVGAALAAHEGLAKAIEWVAEAFQAGGRTVYVGAGTSARIAAADAAEMPPTFGVEPGRFLAIVAGNAATQAVEGAEDDTEAAQRAIDDLAIETRDVVIGISASGRTPFVIAAITAAKTRTIGIANNPNSPLLEAADLGILLDTGPEVLTGSTRLKAGTAQKIALNTISTGAMVLAGRVRGNAMSHMTPKNDKLRARAIRIVSTSLGISESDASKKLENANWDLPKALASE
ncbi:MAG: N-acetylmuramic acid 6-phosphate etherase [Fimbriimonadales bacterium]